MSEGNSWPKFRKVRDAWLAGKSCHKCGTDQQAVPQASWRTQQLNPIATSRIWSMPEEKRQRYLADCVVLCRSCSTSRAQNLNHFRNEHGGGAQGVRGCKCDLCIEQRRRYNRERARKRRGSA